MQPAAASRPRLIWGPAGRGWPGRILPRPWCGRRPLCGRGRSLGHRAPYWEVGWARDFAGGRSWN